MPKIDSPSVTSGTPKEERGKRWVEVPDRDLFDFEYPHIRINLLAFGPGRHFVDADLADTIEERMQVKNAADIQIMRPSQDIKSQNAMNRFGSGSRTGRAVDPNSF